MDHEARVATLPGARFRARAQRRVRHLADAVLGVDNRLRIRVTQWLITVIVYGGCGLVFGLAVHGDWVSVGSPAVAWCVFVASNLIAVYIALRTGWSARFQDAGLTTVQIVMGVVAVCWAYVLAGPFRTAVLLALLLTLVYGAFSLGWRRIMAVTGFALLALVAAIVIRNGAVGADSGRPQVEGLRIDLFNLGMTAVLLPATSLVAARLSSLRGKLRLERRALRQALGEVQRLATRDELTGLPNRRHMQELLDREHARHERSPQVFSVALIDLDHFKRINDCHGHAAGDAVLRSFALTAVAGLRGQDVMGRWGGEEFLLLMPGTAADQALASVQRMLGKVRHLPYMDDEALSFSAGVAEYRAGDTIAQLLEQADARMYAAKRAGRGIVRLD